MRATTRALMMAMGAVLVLSACASKQPKLMHLRSPTAGPDEFSILPPKALEMPQDLAALPTPTPGGTNLTDPTPNDDAIVALGGKPQAGRGIAPADSVLLAQARRYGSDAGIRMTLAAEDLDYRRANDGRLLERMFQSNRYFKAYAGMALNKQAELARWRKAGVGTPSAPPVLVTTEATTKAPLILQPRSKSKSRP